MPAQCIVIGASAGGLEPLREVVAQLPADFPVPLFVVLHIPAAYPSLLAGILSRSGQLPALDAEDHAQVQPGHIYVAPPDHHLLVDDGHMAVKKGPKENGFRPSVDALFRSAAYSYGPGAIGVVLSGALNDGASGLWSIKRLGGTAIVQEPSHALYPSMPRSAMEYIEADYTGSPTEIGSLLVRLGRNDGQRAGPHASGPLLTDAKRLALETQIAAGIPLPEETVLALGELTQFTCPECHGTLVGIAEGKLLRFRCHTGHGFSAESLLEGLVDNVADLLWQTTRASQELSMLLKHMSGHLRDRGDAVAAQAFQQKSQDLERQANELSIMALGQQAISADKLTRKSEDAESDERPGRRH